MSTVPPSAVHAPPRRFAVRSCRVSELPDLVRIINAAAQASRDVAPIACVRQPLRTLESLSQEIVQGVTFWGVQCASTVVAAMGVQAVGAVDVVRHIYVMPECQGAGLGGALLGHVVGLSRRRLVARLDVAEPGARRFFERHGFRGVSDGDEQSAWLHACWPDAEDPAERSVVVVLPG